MASNEWQLADAKNRFSELVRQALTQGPQRVRRRDEAVVVLDAKEYERLAGRRTNFKEFLMNVPSLEGVDLARSTDKGRQIKL
jgi:prevent-host-death family protein